jgi:hypothetical protein
MNRSSHLTLTCLLLSMTSGVVALRVPRGFWSHVMALTTGFTSTFLVRYAMDDMSCRMLGRQQHFEEPTSNIASNALAQLVTARMDHRETIDRIRNLPTPYQERYSANVRYLSESPRRIIEEANDSNEQGPSAPPVNVQARQRSVDSEVDELSCLLCKKAFEQGAILSRLLCGHPFHARGLQFYHMRNDLRCPECHIALTCELVKAEEERNFAKAADIDEVTRPGVQSESQVVDRPHCCCQHQGQWSRKSRRQSRQ